MVIRHMFFTAMFFLSTLSGNAWSQSTKPTTLADLAKYTGPDRGSLLYEGAKKEGKFSWSRAKRFAALKTLKENPSV